MSRRRRHRRIAHLEPVTVLAVLALASIAGASTMFSSASFSSRTDNSASLASGTITVSNSKAGISVIEAGGMKPGASRSGNLTLSNSGDIGANLTLRSVGLIDTPVTPALSATLDLLVEDITGTPSTVYNGKLAGLGAVGAGNLAAAGGSRTYRLTLSWPAGDEDPGLQGASTSLTFRWEGKS